MSDYKKTLQLPKTSFPMKANLTQKEPEMLRYWQQINAYGAMIGVNAGREAYVLHDGPPYANGHIHLGTALNKVLKDIVVKSRNMRGQLAEYVPGWDCHGLPIEHKVELELGRRDLPPTAIRQRCREYALHYLDIQREEFKRLGVLGAWDQPYLTMHPAYEATTAGELAEFMARGSVSRSKKPILWCISCQTALAEAEVEYKDHTSHSIFVRFPLPDPALNAVFPQADPARTSVIIWTTTPWTIPNNLAVAVHPELDYALVEQQGEYFILAKDRLDACLELFGQGEARVLSTARGQDLEGLKARHPFFDRDSTLVLADYVTLDAGTGCVHTAPGNGQEDYETGLRYGLEVLSPISNEGRFLDTVEHFAGLTAFEANPRVIEILRERGNLLAEGQITHSYPHCWRCKQPVIFRATTQWFISMEANQLRARALEAIDGQVRWIPAWGRERIHNMIANRPDWCISRQRTWGVPIVALLCEACDTAWYDATWVRSVVDRFESYPTGCDYWFDTPLEDLVPAGLRCPQCGASRWKKETDILDVWFDSGTSFAAVVEKRPECRFPADLYLEGSDQHRGWFHSSLLAAMGTRDEPPYRAVLTHGYVVDGEGKKMSKSVGNVVVPQEIIDKFGAEILRMWVASVDYQDDVRVSDEILNRLVDAYRRIRNTCRFLLGNLDDFSVADALPTDQMLPLDRYALDLAWRSHERISKAYDEFEFHRVFHTLHNHCVSELSAFYLDILKDRLYVEPRASLKRRSAQTALWKILMLLLRNMAPVLSFTAEEAFRNLPAGLKPQAPSIFALAPEPAPEALLSEAEREAWETVMAVRAEVTKAIEPRRQSGEIGHSLSAHVTLYLPSDLRAALDASGADLKEIFIVSGVTLADVDAAPADCACGEHLTGMKVEISGAAGAKCQRCWVMSEELGTDAAYPDVCPRCLAALRQST